MTLDEVIDYYSSTYHFSELTGMSTSSFANWRKKGYIPLNTQLRLELLTKGKLIADREEVKQKTKQMILKRKKSKRSYKMIGWKVPRWAVEDFCQFIIALDNETKVVNIFEHNDTHYLIVTDNQQADDITKIKEYLVSLFEDK